MGCLNSKTNSDRRYVYVQPEQTTKPFPLHGIQNIDIEGCEWIKDEAGNLCGGHI